MYDYLYNLNLSNFTLNDCILWYTNITKDFIFTKPLFHIQFSGLNKICFVSIKDATSWEFGNSVLLYPDEEVLN